MDFTYLTKTTSDSMCILKINRPEALNALNSTVLTELSTAIDQIKNDSSVKVIIITGEGKSFVAGADVSEMQSMSVLDAREFSQKGMDVFRKIELLEKPVIAAVNGFALGGGCELAMSCDFIIASEKAKFGQPEVSLGITPGFGGTQRLARIIGTSKAKELIFTGRMIDSVRAKEIGLVNEVFPHEQLIEKATEIAKEIIKNSQNAVRFSKAAINRGKEVNIDTALHIEKEAFALCFNSEEQQEGMKAFIEKRKPSFK